MLDQDLKVAKVTLAKLLKEAETKLEQLEEARRVAAVSVAFEAAGGEFAASATEAGFSHTSSAFSFSELFSNTRVLDDVKDAAAASRAANPAADENALDAAQATKTLKQPIFVVA